MKGFIVYPTYRIIDGKSYVYLFGRLQNGDSFLSISYFKPYFFIKKSDLAAAKKITSFDYEDSKLMNFDNDELTKIILNIPSEVKELREKFEMKQIACYEADIRFVYRFLMDKKIRGSLEIEGEYKKGDWVDRIYEDPDLKPADYFPKNLKVFSFDIETDMKAEKIYCISIYMEEYKKVLMVTDKKLSHVENCKDEKELLEKFVEKVKNLDPDIITGWNMIDFDLNVIRERLKHHKVPFKIGRADWECKLIVQTEFMRDSKAEIPGRMVLDAISMLKGSFVKLEDYKLNTAAKEFLGEEKLLVGAGRHAEIQELYKKNQQRLADYNLKDAQLVCGILNKLKLVELTIQRSILTGMQMDRVNASIASLDFVYLSEARDRGLAANSSAFAERAERIKGGYVMSSKPGIYEYILVLDFKSLYPSIIRTFNIDPYAYVKNIGSLSPEERSKLIEAPNHAHFSSKEGILPGIIESLWNQRDIAKKEKDDIASYAIKILMNSFFGVLANPACRFYSLAVANAITHFGQYIIKETSKKIEEKGYEVIYGDTDSIFVLSGVKNTEDAKKIGEELEKHINSYYDKYVREKYKRKSFLQLEFEKIYSKFLMPRTRGTDIGAKKRYAGILVKDGKEKMDFVGLEFVRRDWTELAKKFQQELLDIVFKKGDVKKYVTGFLDKLKKKELDDLLVYRKAIRKELSEYVKTTPPHVKAARMLSEGEMEGNLIEYYMTLDGPQPMQKLKSKIDYDHYIEKQLRPIADSILCFYDLRFDDLVKGTNQKSLVDF